MRIRPYSVGSYSFLTEYNGLLGIQKRMFRISFGDSFALLTYS
jgi:hypothetical protein